MPIQPEVVETNQDLLTANLFTFEFVGLPLDSPNFNRFEPGARTVETVEQADGGTGLIRKYHGGTIRYEDITIVRVNDGSSNDQALHNFVSAYFATGIKQDGALVKRHKQEILKRVEIFGMNISSEQMPSYDNATAAPEEMNYPMQVDYWEPIF